MEKKKYVKPTLERQAIFLPQNTYLGLGGKNLQWLYLDRPQKIHLSNMLNVNEEANYPDNREEV